MCSTFLPLIKKTLSSVYAVLILIVTVDVFTVFQVKPWVKTSLAPGSGVVTKYLLQRYFTLIYIRSLILSFVA
jgi:hypothetical protein